MNKCQYCSAETRSGAYFCYNCGYRLVASNPCPYCGAETRPGDNFCLNCGNRLPSASPSNVSQPPGDATVPAAAQGWGQSWGTAPDHNIGSWENDAGATIADPGSEQSYIALNVPPQKNGAIEQPARFILRADNGDVLQEYPLDKPEITIGRAPNSDILLWKDKLTSRRHATVRYENGAYLLRDERSANGTFVNGQQIEELAPIDLKDGDHIGIGERELIFHAFGSIAERVEDLPIVSVPYEPPTYRTQDDSQRTVASSDDYGTSSIDHEPSTVAQSDAATIAAPPEMGNPSSNDPTPAAPQTPDQPVQPVPSIPSTVSYAASATPSKATVSRSAAPVSSAPNSSVSENVPMKTTDTSPGSPEPATPLPGEIAMPPSSNMIDLRYSDVSFPDHTVVGRTEGLRIAITCESLNVHAVPLPLERPPDTNQLIQVDVYIIVCPSDFDVEGSNVRTLLVPPHADSAPAFFKLTAKSEGKKKIAVEFFQNTRYLGRAQIETIVEAARQPLPQSLSRPKSVQMTLQMSTISPPDLTILFDRVSTSQDKHYYRYRLLSPIRELNLWFDEFHSPETNITPQGFLEETFSLINRMIWNANLSEYLFFERLKSIGMHLYNRLIPDDLKRLYWNELRNKIKTLVIISYEPWIPWEILRPVNPDTKQVEDSFLCEKFDLTRWLAGSGFPDTLSLEQLGLIMSVSDLDSAKQESAEIKRLLGTKVKEIVSSGEAIYQLLCTTDCSGLHFACHGSFNKENADLSTIALEDGAVLSPIDIEGDRLAFGHCKPLVFLNACDTGQSGYGLTGMGGWAEAFVGRAKCSGFIGSIWKANDDAACKFAIAFYSNLLEGRSVAEAARLARQVIKQAGDPTWLSYTVYANPLAHVEL